MIDFDRPRPRGSIRQRLEGKIARVGGCLVWTGATQRRSLPVLAVNGRLRSVRRLMREMIVGPIPPGHVVARCRTAALCVSPECCRCIPSQEACGVPGERHYLARLSDENAKQARALLAQGLDRGQVARQLGVPRRTITDLDRGKTYRRAA